MSIKLALGTVRTDRTDYLGKTADDWDRKD
jgi:hypothetical protein